MNTMSDAQGPGWDEIAEDDQEAPTAGSRRRLLVRVAGGFALATSGLFLPDWLAETEAREGALGGAKGGRRGKDHRGRHKKRTHGDKKGKGNNKDNDKPRGFGLSGIDFTIEVERTGGKTLNLQYYSASDPFGHFKPQGGDTITKDETTTGFKTISTSAFVWINNRYYIEATNPLAALLTGKVGYGGRVDGNGWHDGAFEKSGPLDRAFGWTVGMEVDGLTFSLRHVESTSSYQHVALAIW